MESKTKSAVISEAARIIATHHPNQESYLKRWEIWKTTFDWICRDIPESQADKAAKIVVEHVKNILAQKRRPKRKRRTKHKHVINPSISVFSNIYYDRNSTTKQARKNA